jgi:hypothetical protein
VAAITDYTTLQAALTLLGKRADIASNAELLIQLAEVDILIDLDNLIGGEKVTTLATVASQEYVNLPSDYAGGIRRLANQNPAYDLTASTLQRLSAAWDRNVGYPEEYAIGPGATQGTYRAYFRAIPDAVYTLDFIYSAKPDPLRTTSSNWLLTAFPNVYLYGALRQAAAFAKEDERVPLWQAAYSDAVRKAKQRGEDLEFGTTLVMRSPMGMTP